MEKEVALSNMQTKSNGTLTKLLVQEQIIENSKKEEREMNKHGISNQWEKVWVIQ